MAIDSESKEKESKKKKTVEERKEEGEITAASEILHREALRLRTNH